MRRSLLGLRLTLYLLLGLNLLQASAQEPVGTIKITRRSVAEGVGLSWGDGLLTYGGRDYPFTFQARGLLRGVDPKIAADELSGAVFNLNRPEDFAGNYQKIEGDAPAGEVSRVTIRNQNGVVVTLVSIVEGRRFNLGADGMDIELKK
jgi:hypothetical protein